MNSTTSLQYNAAIVVTVADAKFHIETFITYHLAIGFRKIYLFVDDNCSTTIEIAKKFDNVDALKRDELLHYQQFTPTYKNAEMRSEVDSEVMVRQEINIYLADAFAKYDDIDWLLHIDLDELFYLNGTSLDEHLSSLDKNQFGGMCYLNYEAIPIDETNNNIFCCTPYYRKNHFKRGHWMFSDKQRQFLSDTSWISDKQFNYYQNGKSIYRVSDKLIVDNVHSIRSKYRKHSLGDHESPLILHHPITTFQELEKKYTTLGDFSDLWRGNKRAGKFIDTFHLEARDAFLAGDKTSLKTLYEQKVRYNFEQINELLSLDLAVRINGAIEIISSFNTKISKPFISHKNTLKIVNSEKIEDFNTSQITINVFSLVYEEQFKSAFIQFRSESEAKIWMKRNTYSNNIWEIISRGSKSYFLSLKSNPELLLLDIEQPKSYDAISKKILHIALKVKYVVIESVIECHYLRQKSDTELIRRLKKYYFVKKVIDKLPESRKLRVIMPFSLELMQYLPSLLKLDQVTPLYIEGLNTLIADCVKNENPSPLRDFIDQHFPLNSKTTIFIERSPRKDLLNNEKIDLHLSIVNLLAGGFVDTDTHTKTNCNVVLSHIRDKLLCVSKGNFRILPLNNEKILALYSNSPAEIFLALFNFSCKETEITDKDIGKTGISKKWKNLINKNEIDLKNGITILPNNFYWLTTPDTFH